MLPRDSRPPAFPPSLLASPSRAYARAEMASDGDITRPHNPIPRIEIPSINASQWHVHLELRPEQLVALHRMGLTSGALAWREGMDRWQPLQDGSDGESLSDADADSSPDDGEDRESSGTQERPADGWSMHPSARPEPPRGFAFPRGGPGATVGLVHAMPVSTRPPPAPSQDEHVLDDLLAARPLPPPPRMPGSLPAWPSDDASYEPALHTDLQAADAGYEPASLALIPKPAWLTQSQTPVALSIPPPTPLGRYGGSRAVLKLRTLWLGMGATVIVSAAVAALVSSLVWNLHSRFNKFKTIGSKPVIAGADTAKRAEHKAATEPVEPQPTSVSIDQLPLLSGARAAVPVTLTGSELERNKAAQSEPREDSKAPERTTSLGPRRGAPAKAPLPPVATTKVPSSIEAAVAERLREESEPKHAEASEPPAPPGPADLDAVAKIVAQAAGAAKSCGTGPESGQVVVKFAPSGSAQSIQLLKPFSNRDTNACVLRAMSRARVAPFTGEPVSVRKSMRW